MTVGELFLYSPRTCFKLLKCKEVEIVVFGVIVCTQNETPLELAIRSRNLWVITKMKAIYAGRGLDKSATLFQRIRFNEASMLSSVFVSAFLLSPFLFLSSSF